MLARTEGAWAHEGYTAFELYLCVRPLVTARQSPAPRWFTMLLPWKQIGTLVAAFADFFFLGLSTCTFPSPALADDGCKLQGFVVSGASRLFYQHLPESVLADESTCWLLGHVVSGASSLFCQHLPESVLADEGICWLLRLWYLGRRVSFVNTCPSL